MSLPKQLLESKLITDEQWKEYQELKEEVNDLRRILNMQHKREYYSKFFKDFQKEKGKNVYPDFDEIYKRYDKQKEEIERLNNRVKQLEKSIMISNKKHSFMTKDNIKLRTIINELEKESYLGMMENQNNNDYAKGLYTAYKYINDKLQELKGTDKE